MVDVSRVVGTGPALSSAIDGAARLLLFLLALTAGLQQTSLRDIH